MSLFQCCIPGKPIMGDFIPIDSKTLALTLPEPMSISQLMVCLTRPELPPAHGVGVYYLTNIDNAPSFLGSLTLERPSDLFIAPWYDGPPCEIQLRVVLEPLELLKDYIPACQTLEIKSGNNVKGIARDLHNFMSSFTPHPTNPNMIVVPSNVIDRWLIKFEDKHRKHPFFWMHNDL